MKPQNNSLQLPKPTRHNHKIANKLTIVFNGKINFQTEDDHICHVVKVQSMAEVIPFQLMWSWTLYFSCKIAKADRNCHLYIINMSPHGPNKDK